MGGVLFDWRSGMSDTANFLAVEEKLVLDGLTEHLEHMELGQKSLDEAWKKILEKLGRQYTVDQVMAVWQHTKHWISDTFKLADELDQAGYQLVIFTNNWSGVIDEYFKILPQSSAFKHIVDSSSEGLRKPDPASYQVVEGRLGSKGNEIYFIDDSEPNIEAAKKRGWQTFLYDLGDDSGKKSNDAIRRELLSGIS